MDMKLYIAHVGFSDPTIGIHELHCNIFVAAPDAKTAKEIVRKKPLYLEKRMHIDGIEEIVEVDGYQITLQVTSECKP